MEEKLREKIEKFLEKADRKLEGAERLYESGMYDDSISRAYYAMYQLSLAMLLTKGVTPKTHSGMLTMFSLHFIKTGQLDKRYFDMLSAAKDLRENGDYEPFFAASEEDARLVLDSARAFVKEAKQFLIAESEKEVNNG